VLLGLTEDAEIVGDAKTNHHLTDGGRTNTGTGLSSRKRCFNPQVHPDSVRNERTVCSFASLSRSPDLSVFRPSRPQIDLSFLHGSPQTASFFPFLQKKNSRQIIVGGYSMASDEKRLYIGHYMVS
jgi:hypothetical protein